MSVALGPKLIGLATASIDVSDGLIADLRHVCEVSRLAAAIEAARVPLSVAGRKAVADNPDLLSTPLTGGNDYEILFTAAIEAGAAVADMAQAAGIDVTRIGRMVEPPGDQFTIFVTGIDGRPMAFPSGGWTHF